MRLPNRMLKKEATPLLYPSSQRLLRVRVDPLIVAIMSALD
jgi:hypothetical protein